MAGPTIEDRVAAGAAWLDERKPGWESLICLDTLDLAVSHRGVLGQAFVAEGRKLERGEFGAGKDGCSYALLKMGKSSPAALGFDTWWSEGREAAGPDSYRLLEEEWRRVLAARAATTPTGGLDGQEHGRHLDA